MLPVKDGNITAVIKISAKGGGGGKDQLDSCNCKKT